MSIWKLKLDEQAILRSWKSLFLGSVKPFSEAVLGGKWLYYQTHIVILAWLPCILGQQHDNLNIASGMLNFQYIVISTDFKVSFMTCTIKVLGQILRKGQSISLKALLETISKVIIFISFQFLQLVNLLSKHTDSTQTSILQNQFQLVKHTSYNHNKRLLEY